MAALSLTNAARPALLVGGTKRASTRPTTAIYKSGSPNASARARTSLSWRPVAFDCRHHGAFFRCSKRSDHVTTYSTGFTCGSRTTTRRVPADRRIPSWTAGSSKPQPLGGHSHSNRTMKARDERAAGAPRRGLARQTL
ncbi:hypothetical protein ANO11243_068030 [Dothideomycetidae sp. 11243]|nr:hypothetical protein ANO11243_068030 [fungal sp. No.11243]